MLRNSLRCLAINPTMAWSELKSTYPRKMNTAARTNTSSAASAVKNHVSRRPRSKIASIMRSNVSARSLPQLTGRKLDAPGGDVQLTLAGFAFDGRRRVAVFLNQLLVLGDANGTGRRDDDALPRQEVDDVGVPVAGASISDLMTDQESRQLRMRVGLWIDVCVAEHAHVVDEICACP